jgi:rsbT antagonist protein RsbS
MGVPVLKQGDTLIVTIQAALDDEELEDLRAELAELSALDVMDSFATRTLLGIAKVGSLRGAHAIICGIQPDVAFAMVQLGLLLEGVETALDLDDAMLLLQQRKRSALR